MSTRTKTVRRTGVATVLALVAALLTLVAGASPAAATTFSNTTPITVADGKLCLNCTDPGVGSPYPSTISVSGLAGTVSDVSVTLNNVTHPYPQDFDLLLVGPQGQKLVLASDSGDAPTSNANITLSDAAASLLPATGAWASGTYKPTNRDTGPAELFPGPAPAGPYSSPAPTGSATFASVFGGSSPNGSWSLYAVDDALGDSGTIGGGWALNITTANLAPTTTTVSSSNNPSLTGDPVSLTATVTSGGSPVTGGTVTVTDNGTPMGTTAVNASGQVTVSTAGLGEGSHTITATYNGDPTHATSSGSLQQVVDNPTTKVGNAFCNTGDIKINDASGGPTAGYPYPSRIFTTGLTDIVDTVKVTLDGVTHPYADDLDVLLVGPDGQRMVVASDAGGGNALSSQTTTFRDDAANAIPTIGGWLAASRPVDHGTGDSFPAPAPATFAEPAPAGSATFASVFGGTSPNGTWSLYVVDDSLGGTGNVTGGWCVDVSTVVAPKANADSYSTAKDTALDVPAPGVLGNDTPPGLTAVPIAAGATTQGGLVTLVADGHFSYTPPVGFTGDDTFTYTATDGTRTDNGTVTVHVSNAPTLVGKTVTRRQGAAPSSSTIATVDDVETAPGALNVTLGAVPAGLAVTGVTNTAGTITADVSASCTAATGNRTVPLTVTDGDGNSTDGSFTVDVTGNGAPTLAYADASRTEGQASTVDPSSGPADDGGVPTLSIAPAQTTYPGAVSVAPSGRVSLPAAAVGDYLVAVRAADGCGLDTVATFAVHVVRGDAAPTAEAGGPYTVAEGQPLDLDGSGSGDPDGDPLTYHWDVDGDGQFDDATGAKPHLTWSDLEALGIPDGPASLQVALRVDDGSLTDDDSAGLQVTNTPPTASGPATATGRNGVPVTLALTASDPSSADEPGLTWRVDWGDGTTTSTLTHAYAGVGVFSVSATASDKDGGTSDPVDVAVTVSGAVKAANPCGAGSVLLISGTDQADTIRVTRAPGGALVVSGLGDPRSFTDVSTVRAYGLGGDDRIVLAPRRTLNRVVYGGAGDDELVAGRGADVLVGGDGNDLLQGGRSRDVAIGGTGADDVRGGIGSDLLVAGSTDFDAADVPLCQLRKAWRGDAAYDDRIAALSDPSSTPSLVPGVTVHDDGAADHLTGGAGQDWLLYNRSGGGVRDSADRVRGETGTDL